MHIDSLFCYAAHHGGIGEVVLPEPMRIYHTEHLSAAGWTPEGEQERLARIETKASRRSRTPPLRNGSTQCAASNAP